MRKSTRKNQIVITALAVMIAVAGYLNFTGQEINTSGLTSLQNKDASTEEESKEKEFSEGEIPTEESTEEMGETETNEGNEVAEGAEEGEYIVADSGEVLSSKENPGEAVMVSNAIGADYFAAAKLSREQTRAQNKETLMTIVNNEAISSADKKAAIREVADITECAEKESAAELMLQAKGFEDAMVSITGGSADVVVNAEGLSESKIAQISDIVSRKTGITLENIVVTPVSVSESGE